MTNVFDQIQTYDKGAKIVKPRINPYVLLKDIKKVFSKTKGTELNFLRKIVFVFFFIVARFSYWYGYVSAQNELGK